MWPQITKYLPEFPTAVLSGVDKAGYPYSLRCRPALDMEGQRLQLTLPTAPLEEGPACLLCHNHDERLWNLKSFVVRGTLTIEQEAWVLIPRQFIPGMGIGGWRSYVRFVRHGRAATRAYFAKRGMSQPRVDIEGLMAQLVGTTE